MTLALAFWRERSYRKETVRRLRKVASAIDSYQVDYGPLATFDGDDGTAVLKLRSALEPTYVKRLPTTDGWGYPLMCVAGEPFDGLRVVSWGRDGRHGPRRLDINCLEREPLVYTADDLFAVVDPTASPCCGSIN